MAAKHLLPAHERIGNAKRKKMPGRDYTKLLEANRNFTVGQPSMFTELERLCRRIREASIARLIRWHKVWPKKLATFERLHRIHCNVFGEKSSPYPRKIAVFAGALEYLKSEAAARQNGRKNTFDFSTYDPERVTTTG
jgi:hypothetical protein